MKTQFVIGFLFKNDEVALIAKNRPEWQRGKLNGVGGHIENGETPLNAMRREFCEEAGGFLESWEYYCTMTYPDAEIYCFRCFEPYTPINKTDEVISWYLIDRLPKNVIPNLNWLIPLALYDDYFLEIVKIK